MSSRATQRRADPAPTRSCTRTLASATLLAAALLAATAPARAQQRLARFQPLAAAAPSPTAPALAPLAAPPTNHSWELLASTAQRGKKLTVILKQADPASDLPDKRAILQGELLAIDATSLTLRQAGAPRVVPAADVLRVRYAGVRERHVLRGLVAGVVLGGVGLWAADSQSSNPEPGSALAMGAFFGGALGAITGAVYPVNTLYEASASAP